MINTHYLPNFVVDRTEPPIKGWCWYVNTVPDDDPETIGGYVIWPMEPIEDEV